MNTDEALDAARALARALEDQTCAAAASEPDEAGADGVVPLRPIRNG